MISDEALRELIQKIRGIRELSGCMIGYQGPNSCRVISYPSCMTPYSEKVAVIIEEVTTTEPTLVAQLERLAASGDGTPRGAPGAQIATNRSKLGPELLGAGISCGFMVVSAIGVAASVATEVPTGGASSFLLVASWVGLGSGMVQCGNGLARVGAIYDDPGGDTLVRWDANTTYANAMLLVDAAGIASAVGSLPFGVKNLWAVLARERALESAGLTFERLRSMNRVERLRALTRAFEQAARTPEGRSALLQAAKDAKLGVDPLRRASGISVKHSDTLRKIITDETVRRVSASIRDVASGVLGILASSSPATWTGSASGSVNWVINLVDGGTPNL